MLLNILIGCGLLVLTTSVHGTTMMASLRSLRVAHAEHWAARSHWTRSAAVALLVLLMSVAGLIEAALWAGTYLALDAISGFEEALYFSLVTYTTLGYGDVVMDEQWRLLSSIQAANGIIMFGWTTALVYAVVHRVYFARAAARASQE